LVVVIVVIRSKSRLKNYASEKKTTRQNPNPDGDETSQGPSDSSLTSPVRSGNPPPDVHTPINSTATGIQSSRKFQMPGSFAQSLLQDRGSREEVVFPNAPGGKDPSVTFLAAQMCQSFQQQMTVFMENFLRTQRESQRELHQVRHQQQQQFLQDLRATQVIERQIAQNCHNTLVQIVDRQQAKCLSARQGSGTSTKHSFSYAHRVPPGPQPLNRNRNIARSVDNLVNFDLG